MNTTNTIKTAALLAALTALFALVGQAFGGTTGMLLALAFAVLMNGAAYWFSDRLALAMARARPVSRAQAPELYHLVDDLARRAGVPTPRVYVVDNASPNAFATGRDPNHAAVAVTTGILQLLDPRELYGVLAHEFAHIKHRDILLTSVAATIAGAITSLAHLFQLAAIFGHSDDGEEGAGLFGALALLILAPIAATLLQLSLSRSREYAPTRPARGWPAIHWPWPVRCGNWRGAHGFDRWT